jgi:hypothetical protein
MSNLKYKNFKDFYPFYLSQHQHSMNKFFHFIGTLTSLLFVLSAIRTRHWELLIISVFIGYAFAWIGHFVFEKNKPATFNYPWYSFLGDWVMFKDIIIGKIKI